MSTHVVNIEDDRSLRDILRVAFQAVEPRIKLQQFSSAEEALPYIEEHAEDIDLFVLDIRLPGTMDGIEIAQTLHERNYRGRVVLSSAYSSPKKDELESMGAEYVAKPWHIKDLTQKLLNRSITEASFRLALAK